MKKNQNQSDIALQITKGKSIQTMNEALPKVINITIPFNLGVKINENGSKSTSVGIQHAAFIGKAGEGDKEFRIGGTAGGGYMLEYKGLDDCRYKIDAQGILDAFVESLEKAGFNLD